MSALLYYSDASKLIETGKLSIDQEVSSNCLAVRKFVKKAYLKNKIIFIITGLGIFILFSTPRNAIADIRDISSFANTLFRLLFIWKLTHAPPAGFQPGQNRGFGGYVNQPDIAPRIMPKLQKNPMNNPGQRNCKPSNVTSVIYY